MRTHYGIIGNYAVHRTADGHHLIVEYESDEVSMTAYFSRDEAIGLSKAILEFISTAHDDQKESDDEES